MLCVFGLLSIGTMWLVAQSPINQREVRLAVYPEGGVRTYWKIHGTTVSESLNLTESVLEVENVSKTTIEGAIFYADYFDATGRLCFNAMFNLAGNFGGRKGSVGPSEVRVLYSSAHLLAPAVDPRKAKVYLVRQKLKGGEEKLFESPNVINSPVLVKGFGLAGLPWQELILGQELVGVHGPLLDLALARLSVGKDGNVRTVDVLNSVSPSVNSWFQDFVSHLRFTPPQRGGIALSGSTLLLARAVLTNKGISEPAHIPRRCPWIEKYIESHVDIEVPPINTVFLQPRDTSFTEEYLPGGTIRRTYDFPEKAAGGYYVYNDMGSQWSLGVANKMFDVIH
jgi:hypothetical protein